MQNLENHRPNGPSSNHLCRDVMASRKTIVTYYPARYRVEQVDGRGKSTTVGWEHSKFRAMQRAESLDGEITFKSALVEE